MKKISMLLALCSLLSLIAAAVLPTSAAVEKPIIYSHDEYETIPSDEDLTLRWDRVRGDCDHYYVRAKILRGAPAGGDNEKAVSGYDFLDEYVTRRRFTIEKEDLLPGKWLKVYVESRNSDGAYLSHYAAYLFIEDSDTPIAADMLDDKGTLKVNSDVKLVDNRYVYKSGDKLSLVEPAFYLEPSRNVETTANVDDLKTIIDQFDVLNEHNSSAKKHGSGFYYPSSGSTYCTTYARDLANAMGACLPAYCCSSCGYAKAAGLGEGVAKYLKEKSILCTCRGSSSSLMAFHVKSKSAQNTYNDLYCYMKVYGETYGWEAIPAKGKDKTAMAYANQGLLVIGIYSDYNKHAGHVFAVYPSNGSSMHQAQAGGTGAMSDGSVAWNSGKAVNYHRNPGNSWITYYVFKGLK